MSLMQLLMSRGDDQGELVTTPKPDLPVRSLESEFDHAALDSNEPLQESSTNHHHKRQYLHHTSGHGSLNEHQAAVAAESYASSASSHGRKDLTVAQSTPHHSNHTNPSITSTTASRLAHLFSSSSSASIASLVPSFSGGSLASLSSPNSNSNPNSNSHSHHNARTSLHLSFTQSPQSISTLASLPPPSPAPSLNHTPNSSHKRTAPFPPPASPSLVPRHDYIPSLHRSHSRGPHVPSNSPQPPSSSPIPPLIAAAAGSGTFDSSAVGLIDPSLVAPSLLRNTSALIPILPPASFVPPSPPPMTSPYKSILRTAQQKLNEKGVVVELAERDAQTQAMEVSSTPHGSAPPTPKRRGSISRDHAPLKTHAPTADEIMRSLESHMDGNGSSGSQDSLASTVSLSQSQSQGSPTDSDDDMRDASPTLSLSQSSSLSPSPSPEPPASAAEAEAASLALALALQKEQCTRRLRPSRGAREAEESKHSAHVALKSTRSGRGHAKASSVDLGLRVSVQVKPAKPSHRKGAASLDLVSLASRLKRASSDEQQEEHKAPINTSPQKHTTSGASSLHEHPIISLTPSRHKRRGSTSSASSVHAPHSAPPKSHGSSHSHRPRVRFDRAEIHLFDLIPDASKVPGGDGEYAVGMERTPHTSWIASLDTYENLRSKERKEDGPEAIDEEERKRIWLAAQSAAERLNEAQRRKSGIKRLHPAEEHALLSSLTGHKRKRDPHSSSDAEYPSDDSEEEEFDEDAEDAAMDAYDASIAAAAGTSTTASTTQDDEDTTMHDSSAVATSSFLPRPPSPSSACFRFVVDTEGTEKHSSVNDTPLAPPTLLRAHSAPSSLSSPLLSPSSSPPPPLPTKILFSDHADLELIRASRRTAGCSCRGSKSVKVCGPLEDMRTEAMLREAKRSTKKDATAGLRHHKAAKTSLAMTSATGDPYTEESSAHEPHSSDMEVCPCYAAGVGCNSNICRCFTYCCANTEERYVFNQAKVNAIRRKVLKTIKGK